MDDLIIGQNSPAQPGGAPNAAAMIVDGDQKTFMKEVVEASRTVPVLVDFWATWCDPCRAEIPHFVELQNKYRSQGFRIVGISMDDGPGPVRDFYGQYKMNYPVAMGDAKLAGRFGGVLGLPVSFLIGRDGRIYARHVGETEPSVFEGEIKQLLARPAAASGL